MLTDGLVTDSNEGNCLLVCVVISFPVVDAATLLVAAYLMLTGQ